MTSLLPFCLAVIALSSGERVVFIPLSQTSHVKSHISVAKELASMGHDVWVATPRAMASRVQTGASPVNLLLYGEGIENVEDSIIKKSGLIDNFWAGMDTDFAMIWRIGVIMWQNSIDTLEDPEFLHGINKVNPDLIILDGVAFCKNMAIVPYKLGKPFAFYGTFVDPIMSRIPFTSACNPMLMSDLDDVDMSFSHRFLNSLTLAGLTLLDPLCKDNNIVSRYAPEKTDISVADLTTQAEVFVIETDYILDYARPMLPNTKLVGGSSARPAETLKEPFKSIADSAKRGILIVSFGSNVLDLPGKISKTMMDAFQQIDLQIIWRANLTVNSANISTSTWLPQNDLLGHNNTRMFLSHCGANGLYETLYHGVPVLCAPIFAEQFHNARRVVNKGYGLRIDIRTITAQDLADVITEVATNSSYRKNIKMASKLFKELFKDPVKTAAFWFDHVIQYGGRYMRFAGQDMPLYKFLLFDVTAALFLIVIFVVFMLFLAFKLTKKCLSILWRIAVRLKGKLKQS